MAKSFRVMPRGAVRAQMVMLLVLIGLVAGFMWLRVSDLESQARQQSTDRTIRNFFSNLAPMSKLDSVYSDADGDLLADAPENEQLCIEPSALTFAFIASEDSSNAAEVWQPVIDALETKAGIPCTYLRLTSTKDQLQAFRSGQLHVTAFSSGQVPSAVNTCGFVPVCTMGKEDGSFGYNMQFIVSAKSKIKDLAELRAKEVAFTRPRSNAGYKAALVELATSHKLFPERDYKWHWAYEYVASMKDVAAGKADSAPVPSDLFAREAAKGVVNADDYRVIYESESFPPLAFGYAYNLKAEMRESIKQALLEFSWEGTSVAEAFGGDGSTQFVELSYKDDWANIRRIDRAALDIKAEVLAD